jgi:hypothetical protein
LKYSLRVSGIEQSVTDCSRTSYILPTNAAEAVRRSTTVNLI